MAEIKPGAAGVITNITQIATRNHNDTQNRDAADAHPASSITGLTVITRDYGYTAGGWDSVESAVTEKYDDVANTWTAKTSLTTARELLAGFSLNGYGYTAGGQIAGYSVVTEKYDDVANAWTTKQPLTTARAGLAGFSLNGYGYTAGGDTGAPSAVTEKYDDVANTWTAKANLNTARAYLAGFSLNGYGYTAGGSFGVAVTEKYDDVADTWTTKQPLTTGRDYLTGFSLNSYGYTAGGDEPSAVTEKYDDVANAWTAKANLNTARSSLAGFSLNGYGYTAGGYVAANSAVVEKYDDVANAWTTKQPLTTARYGLAGFSLGALHAGVQNPEIIPLWKRINRPTIPVDVTLTPRVLGTTYTNSDPVQNLMVMATVRCAITVAGGNAYVQAESPPATAASGIIGIQAGLLSEDNSFQIVFIVRPTYNYRIVATASNGTVTLGSWFEMLMK